MTDHGGPDADHQRPDGVSDDTIEALGKLAAAFDHIQGARGRLYDFHRLCGSSERVLEEATDMLRDAGHGDVADRLDRELLGRNPLPGMWSFQMVEGYDDTYYDPATALHRSILDELVDGKRHVFEAEMKELRRTHDKAGHEPVPQDALDAPERADDAG